MFKLLTPLTVPQCTMIWHNWDLSCHVQLGDPLGQATAQMNVSDLRKALGLPAGELSPDSEQLVASFTQPSPGPALRRYRVRRESMEQLQLIKVALCLFACARCYPHILLMHICLCNLFYIVGNMKLCAWPYPNRVQAKFQAGLNQWHSRHMS